MIVRDKPRTKPNTPGILEQEYERAKCAEDIIYFIETYLYVFDPRATSQVGAGWVLFKLWDKQKLYIQFLEEKYRGGETNVAVEKCRDIGATLLTLAWIFHHWMFDENFRALIGSYKEEYTRWQPDDKSLFHKLDDYMERLPDWLKPEGYSRDHHFEAMTLSNPKNGNSISGEAATPNFGVGARKSVIFRDEAALWEHNTLATGKFTAQFQIDCSTVRNTFFVGICDACRKVGNLFIFDRKDHPVYATAEWYDKARAAAEADGTLHIFKREVDRDYKASAAGLIYPMIALCPRGVFKYRPDWPLFTIWDFGVADEGYVGFVQRDPVTLDLFLIAEVHNNNVGIDWYLPFIPGKRVLSSGARYEPEHLAMIAEHATWTGPRKDFGDPSGKQRNHVDNRSVFDVLKLYDVEPKCVESTWQNMPLRQQITGNTLRRLSIGDNCPYFFDTVSQFAVKPATAKSTADFKAKGIHDFSHAISAFEAFAISEERFAPVKSVVEQQMNRYIPSRREKFQIRGRR